MVHNDVDLAEPYDCPQAHSQLERVNLKSWEWAWRATLRKAKNGPGNEARHSLGSVSIPQIRFVRVLPFSVSLQGACILCSPWWLKFLPLFFVMLATTTEFPMVTWQVPIMR